MSSGRLQQLSRLIKRFHLQTLKGFGEENGYVVLIEFVCGIETRNGILMRLYKLRSEPCHHVIRHVKTVQHHHGSQPPPKQL